MDLNEECFHLGVKTLVRNLEGKFLLLERVHRMKGTYWDIPGGRMQKKESVIETLQRELEEETGLRTVEKPSAFAMILTDIRIPVAGNEVGLILSIYRYDLKTPFIPRLSEEHTNFGWFSASEAAQLLKKQYPAEFIDKLSSLV